MVHSPSHVSLFVTPWTAARQASLCLSISPSLPKLRQMNQLSTQPSHPVVLFHSALGSFPKSQLFANYWSFSFCISLSNEFSALISFEIDWFDLLTLQGTLKSLLQHDSTKALILQYSAFFIVQSSHPHVTIRKTIALTVHIFGGKVMS